MARYAWRSAIPVFLAGAGITAIFLINLCDLIFDCNCHSWWAGAVAQCNIHEHGSRHCPWCSVGTSGFAAIYLGIVIPQAWLSLHPRRWSWPFRLGATLLAFPIVGLLIGIAMGWWMGYWE